MSVAFGQRVRNSLSTFVLVCVLYVCNCWLTFVLNCASGLWLQHTYSWDRSALTLLFQEAAPIFIIIQKLNSWLEVVFVYNFSLHQGETDLLSTQAETSRIFPLVKGFRVQFTGNILLFYCCCPCCGCCCCGGVSCYEVLEPETEGPLWLVPVLWHQSHWGIFRHFCPFRHMCVRVSVPDIGQRPYPSHYIIY